MANKYTIVYQDRESANSSGGVYTEYLMDSDATTSDLPTDGRPGSLAYLPEAGAAGTLYLLDNDLSWGEVGA